MQLQQRINAFHNLAKVLESLSEAGTAEEKELLELCKASNGWFSEDNVKFACKHWSEALAMQNLEQWLSDYEIVPIEPKTVAIVMAGNVPLVGFHDFLSVLMSGHRVLVKLSSNDKHLLPYITKKLIEIEPEFESFISYAEEKLENFDAVIATGSNNTARYFEHYFGKYPSIIRKNRNSVAVLGGFETADQLKGLADDVFRYFGLGCRNVSKVYIPKDYNFDPFFNAMFSWKDVIHDNKYINNYDYNKAVYLMSDLKILDNEFLLLKEDTGFSSPISVVFYEHYENLEALRSHLKSKHEHIQCIVSDCEIDGAIPFGSSQTPGLGDYADGVDTLRFLLDL